jgi:hypothetical protein
MTGSECCALRTAGIENPVLAAAGHFLQEEAGEQLGAVIAEFIRARPRSIAVTARYLDHLSNRDAIDALEGVELPVL